MTSGHQLSYCKRRTSWTLTSMLLALCSCMLAPAKGFAQPDIPVKNYLAHSYYEEDGLASNLVYEMEQSADGLLWFVTQKGISTFDGLRWHTFDYEISPNYADGINLLPLQDGSMLLAAVTTTQVQLAFYQKEKWQPIALPENIVFPDENPVLSRTRLTATQHLPNHYRISLLHNDSLYLYNSTGSLWQSYSLPESINTERIGRMQFFENKLLILSAGGIASFDLGTKEFKMDPIPEITGKAVIDVTSSPNGKILYLMGDNFIGRYSGNEFKTLIDQIYPQAPELPPYMIFHNILADKHNRLFFNYNMAFFKYNLSTQSLEQIKLDDAKSEFTPTDIFEDREGNVWLTNFRGVKKISSFRFHNYHENGSFHTEEVSALLLMDSNTLLLGGNKDIKILSNNKLLTQQHFKPHSSIHFTRILDAVKTPEGEIYIAANSLGLARLRKDNTLAWTTIPNKHPATAVAWHQDSLLVATNPGSLFYFNRKKNSLEKIWKKDRVYIRKILSLDGEITLLTNSGLYKIKGSSTTAYKNENLQQQSLYSYLHWKGKTLLGSMGGLCELINGQIVKITADSLRLDRPVYAMLEDHKGRLWAGTDKGIYVHEQQKYLNFTPQQGLSGKEINRGAFQQMPDGSIWIGTDQGLSIYNPEDDHTPSVTPEIKILQVLAQGTKLNDQEENELDYTQNNLVLLFQTIGFYQPEENNFRYKLEGLEEDWIYSDNHLINQVRYTNLPAGSYQFVIQVRNGNGPWSQEARSNPILIHPPFYKSWWFMLSMLATISSMGYVAHALTTNKRNEKMLRQAIKEKKAEVEKSEKRFRAVWDATDTCFVLINNQGKILMANPSFCQLFNISAGKAYGNFLASLIPDPGFEEQNLQQIFERKKLYRCQVVANLHHQTCYLLATITFVDQQQQDEPLMIVSFKDFTDQKQAETSNTKLNQELVRQNMALLKKEDELANYNHELLQHREELEQALRAVEERNYQLDQFVYKTSHDLRAPIASALGLINIIKMDPDYERWPEYLELINGSLQKQDRFIKSMLNFSKSTRSKNIAEAIDFNALVSQCMQELQSLPDFKEVEQQVQLGTQGIKFYSDKMKLYIILSNIISNSIKYRDPVKKSFLQIQVRLSTEAAEITVIDNGIGIPSQYQNQIFDMFFRATERSDGSGLGLYIVKQTVEKLQGHIIMESEQSKGTSFKVYIPNQYLPVNNDTLIENEKTMLSSSPSSIS
jgi:PAS domain S-box-containing protein